jgi:MFS family permease
MAMSMLVRVFGPIVGGLVYSWSISHDYAWPFNHHLVFIMFAITFAATLPLLQLVPAVLNVSPEYR